MELKRKYICPILNKECIGLDCSWILKMEGYDINTGQKINEWACTVAALPKLLVENAGMQRQTGAAINSFKDEMVKDSKAYSDIIEKTKKGEE
jgi:hypothetical protein